jgi:RHS repeat-associated protein
LFEAEKTTEIYGVPFCCPVEYTYSNASSANDSRLTGIVYPDGYTVNYNYSSGLNSTISRVSSLSDSSGTLQSYTFQGLETVVGLSDPGPSVSETTTLDNFGRVSNMTWTHSSTTLSEYSYTYDDNSNVLSKTDGVHSSLSQLYTYDNLNELTGYQEGTISGGTIGSPTASQSLDYDALGNVTSNTINGGTAQTRSANAQNEYTSISGATTPTYDSNGNMTTDSTGLKYIYDAWNRLVKVENSAGTSTLETFAYDGLGRRIVIAQGSTTTELFYSAAGQVLEESSGGDYTNRYVWSPVYVNALVLRDSMVEVGPSLRLCVIQDANWNVVALVNASGSVVERYDYTPFGTVTIMNASYTVLSSSAYSWIYLLQGGRLDTVTGNYQFGARDYSPVLMRWTTNDPIGLGGGDPNTYEAEGNDVTSAVDPSGLSRLSRWWDRRVDGVADAIASPAQGPYATPAQQLINDSPQSFYPNPVKAGATLVAAPDEIFDWQAWIGGTSVRPPAPPRTGDGLVSAPLPGSALLVGPRMRPGAPRGSPPVKEPFPPLKVVPKTAPITCANVTKTGNLSGLSRADAHVAIRKAGFEYHGTTSGGYVRYRAPDGSEIWLRPNGEVVRLAPKVTPEGGGRAYNPRVDFEGSSLEGHNTGEFVAPLPGKAP